MTGTPTKPKKMKRESAWFSLSDTCRAFDSTKQNFDKTIRPFVEAENIRTRANRVEIYVRGAIEAWAKRFIEKMTGDADGMLGPVSPSLERWRTARAERAEWENDELRKNLIPAADVDVIFARCAGALRQLGDRMKVRHPDAHAMLDETIADLVREFSSDQQRPAKPAPPPEELAAEDSTNG